MAANNEIKSAFAELPAVKQINLWSKSVYMPGTKEATVHEVWHSFLQQVRKANIIERAAAISFNVFMAIPPTLIFVFTLIPYLPISKQFIKALFGLVRDIIPGKQNNIVIIQFLNDFLNKPRNGLLSFALLFALFFSSNAIMGILRSFDKNYEGFYKRRGIRKRQVALRLTLIVFILVLICLALLIAQRAVLKWIGIESDMLRSIIIYTRWIFIILLVFFFTSLIYRYGPALRKKWDYINPGTVLATSLTIIATSLVSFWADHFSNYNKLYGSISAVFILMSLIYVNALVILLGFEFNVTIASLKKIKSDVTRQEPPVKATGNRLL